MSINVKVVGVLVSATAMLGLVGMDVAQASTYPKGGSYHVGGEGATLEPSPDPTTLATASFSPQIIAEPLCGAVAWAGGCG